MTSAAGAGEIVAFYSYKGGTGRSMLLANVAWILASNGKRVLAIDWDLEAPGLHRYFQPFLADRDLGASDGVIDFVVDFSLAALTGEEDGASGGRPRAGADDDRPWFLAYANLLRYASSLQWDFLGRGCIDFVGAGRQGPTYSTRVNSFNWQEFYERYGGGALLEQTRRQLAESYDYVLIDSRTGVSDTSGVCTLHLPDTLVACFTLNNQSIDGVAAVVGSVHEQRSRAGRPIRILPVATRVDYSEKDKLDLRKAYARKQLAGFPAGMSEAERDRYWADVEVPYVPFYAYEEIMATFGDRSGSLSSMLSSAERLAGHLTDGTVYEALHVSEGQRLEVLASYEGRAARPPAGGSIFVSYRRDDSGAYAGRLYDVLVRRFGDAQVLMDLDVLTLGSDFTSAIERAVAECAVLVVLIGPRWESKQLGDPYDFVRLEVEAALSRGIPLIPVLVDGASMPRADDLPEELAGLARRQALHLRASSWLLDAEALASGIERVLLASRLSYR
jgi:cellulose biosynthesis protein BcsQ